MRCLVILGCLFLNPALAADTGRFFPVQSFPKNLSMDCRDGAAQLYDECGSQHDIVNAAVDAAKAAKKTALIVYGGEWCVWCFVFDAAIRGDYESRYYQWTQDKNTQQWAIEERTDDQVGLHAKQLNQFVSTHFVVAHIEGHLSPDGAEAIDATGFNSSNIQFFPAIIALTSEGQYSDHFLAYKAMAVTDDRKDQDGRKRQDFDRVVLLDFLQQLRRTAQ